MTTYPSLEQVRVDMDLDLRGWAVFADDDQAKEVPGLLFEARPSEAEHVVIWSTGDEVHMQPHYTLSTWDEFWADETGRIHATGFKGWFRLTLGEQGKLRAGFLSVLDRAAVELDPDDPRSASTVRTCAIRLRALVIGGHAPSDDEM